LLATLTPGQRTRSRFPVDDPEWRKWINQHFYVRQGTGFADPTQRARAVLAVGKTGNNHLTEAFKDSVVLDWAGVPVKTFTSAQRNRLLALVKRVAGNLRPDQARVQMADVEARLDETWFAWIGGSDDDAVFYYRTPAQSS
jgi:hypothetical protein